MTTQLDSYQDADIRLLTIDEIEDTAGGVAPLIIAGAAFSLFFTGTLTALAAQAK